MRWALYVDAGAGLVRSRWDDGGLSHTVLDPPRASRCAREADARPSHGAEPGRIVDGERRSARLIWPSGISRAWPSPRWCWSIRTRGRRRWKRFASSPA